MNSVGASGAPPVARLSGVTLRYGQRIALNAIDLELPSGVVVGLIGPDGVGKSSLLSVITGARRIREGEVTVFGGDLRQSHHRNGIAPRIAYMPQGLGRNLYPTLSVEENLQFFGRLFDQGAGTRRQRIDVLTQATGLHPFLDRPAGNLSGGMKQKLGLCCALIHDPDLMVLDEPTTGVDPLARSQFWQLLARIRADRPGMSVVVATAYMEEADGFDWIVAMDAGRILATGTPAEIHRRTGSDSLETAFIQLLPEEVRRGHVPVTLPPLADSGHEETAIEARDLTMRFGRFTAVDQVSFRIRRGEIFGFLGSNGCGKTTTMKMLTGLLPASEGRAWLFGSEVNPHDLATRRRVGYMSQAFSLYAELTIEQNLVLHARLFQVPEAQIPARVEATLQRFGLAERREALPDKLPLGLRQRLSLAVAMVHEPELLILDEPTSGVDPVARDRFWQLLIDLARGSGVTVFISTHYMNEAERCDRVSFMHAGRVLVSGAPAEIVRRRSAQSLEEAFIAYLREAESSGAAAAPTVPPPDPVPAVQAPQGRFSPRRMLGYVIREALELRRDPVRAALAMVGSLLLMLIMAYGISMDVEDLEFAVLDRDDTSLSRDYTLNLAGSRYFVEQPPLANDADLDRRMRAGKLALAVEIPPGFARDLKRGTPVQVAAWIDGAMPARADTVRGYVASLHQEWFTELLNRRGIDAGAGYATIETRFRYNPEVTSLPAMVPAVIPILLLMLPAMLTALSVVREKELGSIVNFYVTPVTRAEFLLGKQLPYLALGLLNYVLMVLLAITLFGVPLKGSFATLTLAALVFVGISTGLGLFASVFTRSQIGAMFFTLVGTMLPAISYAGLLNPVSSLEGAGRVIGELFPATHMLTISRGVFAKGLGFADLVGSFWPLLLALPAILGLSLALLRKQET